MPCKASNMPTQRDAYVGLQPLVHIDNIRGMVVTVEAAAMMVDPPILELHEDTQTFSMNYNMGTS